MNESLLPGKPRGGQAGRKRIIWHNLAGIAGVKKCGSNLLGARFYRRYR